MPVEGRDVVLTEKKDHIYIITLNREERLNAIGRETWERLDEEWEKFDEDEDLWVAILRGNGRAFCAGADLKDQARGRGFGGELYRRPPRRRAYQSVPSWKPTIAAIHGHCVAGGWLLAQGCDVRIADETAQFGIPEVKWNLPAGFGAHYEYVMSIGIACEVLLWGRTIDAQRAYQIGFVNKVVPKGKHMDEAMEWAEHMCTLGQDSVRAHKQMIYRRRNMPAHEVDNLGRNLFESIRLGLGSDILEGPKAFSERRAPQFRKPLNIRS